MVDERRPKVDIFEQLPKAFHSAYVRPGCHWSVYSRQGVTPEDVLELRVLWRLTGDVNVVCARLAELAPGGAWLIAEESGQQSTTGGQTDGE